MTCIVGLVEKNKGVWMGGDSAGVGGEKIESRKEKKVFRNGDFLIGGTGSFRMLNLLQWKFMPPNRPATVSVIKYMNTIFIDEIRKTFRENGYLYENGLREEGGAFLLAYCGRLFKILSDFQVGEPLLGYTSVGSGSHFALGSLHSTKESLSRKRILKALQAAEWFCTSVGDPLNIMFLEKKE